MYVCTLNIAPLKAISKLQIVTHRMLERKLTSAKDIDYKQTSNKKKFYQTATGVYICVTICLFINFFCLFDLCISTH